MAARWTVNKNTGDKAELSFWSERREVLRPKELSVEDFLDLLNPGTLVLDRVVESLSTW